MAEMLVQESGDLSEGLLGLRHAIVKLVLGMGHSFEDFELCIYASFAELAVHAYSIAQQQVAGSGGEDGRREAVHVSIDGGKQGISEIVTMGGDHGGRGAESIAGDQDVVDQLVRVEAVAGLGDVRHWSAGCDGAWERKPQLPR